MWDSFSRHFMSWWALFNRKIVLSLKVIDTYYIFSSKAQCIPNGHPEDQSLKIDSIYYKRLNATKIMKLYVNCIEPVLGS